MTLRKIAIHGIGALADVHTDDGTDSEEAVDASEKSTLANKRTSKMMPMDEMETLERARTKKMIIQLRDLSIVDRLLTVTSRMCRHRLVCKSGFHLQLL